MNILLTLRVSRRGRVSMKVWCSLLCLWMAVSTVFGGYSVTEGKIGQLNTMVISNDQGEMVEIVTDFGGRVESLYLKSMTSGKLRNVLLGHNGDSDAIIDNKYWKGMLLIPFANRIAYGKYTFFNGTYSLPLNDSPRMNSLHGFMPNKTLKILYKFANETVGYFVAATTISNEPGYPFTLNLVITYAMSSDYGFAINVNATNANGDGTPLPFYMGWHPYFNCTAYSSTVELDLNFTWAHVEMNSNLDPTGITKKSDTFDGSKPIGGTKDMPTFYDDEYKVLDRTEGSTAVLFDKETDQAVALYFDRAFNYVHVYTGSSTTFNEDGVAIEPMSGMADAYNNHDGLTVISDGQTWTGGFGVLVL